MIAHLLIKESHELKTMKVVTVPIFGDCIVCEAVREVNNDSCVYLGSRKERVSIISCLCSNSLLHRPLLMETEIIEMMADADILTTG